MDFVAGPRGRAVVIWFAARSPLRMQWRVGKRTFKSAAEATSYARAIVGLNDS